MILVDPASFRDRRGHVYHDSGRVFRTITKAGQADFEFALQSGAIERLVSDGRLIQTEERCAAEVGFDDPDIRVIEHPRLEFISYPYEWPFALLRKAALHHLDLQLEALKHAITLSDASAYNIQFSGIRPIFIDLLSLRRYRQGEYWLAHRQFCEQFLNPLLLQSMLGVPFQSWFRGTPEGISAAELTRLFPYRKRFSLYMLIHVTLPARFQRAPRQTAMRRIGQRGMPLQGYRNMLLQLHRWITSLKTGPASKSEWSEYAFTNTYSSEAEQQKQNFVRDFVGHTRPRLLWDIGCNTGLYSEIALQSGADLVVGLDADPITVDAAVARAEQRDLKFLPLVQNVLNPSPGQGWRTVERQSLSGRSQPEAVMALALVHHLAISGNIPLRDAINFVIGIAPNGIIEFVPKSDPTVQRMLYLREDVFTDYCEEAFDAAIGELAQVVRQQRLHTSGRKLVWYQRPK